jgi:hypothetical protein
VRRERPTAGRDRPEREDVTVTPQARKRLQQTFLRLLRAREPTMVWTLAPDEAKPIGDRRTLAGARSRSDSDPLKDGGE